MLTRPTRDRPSSDQRAATAGRRVILLAIVACGLLTPTPAAAHLVTTGLGPYYDGIGHLLVTPQDVLPLIGLALLAGLAGPDEGRLLLFTLPVAWLLGGLAGLTLTEEITAPFVAAASVLAVGGLLAADRGGSRPLVGGLGVTIALIHGFLNGTAMSAAGYGARSLLGITGAVFVVLALASSLAVSLRDGWTRIAVRVAGSWMVATGLFMLGWALR